MEIEQIKQALMRIEQDKRYLNNLAKTIEGYRNRVENPPSAKVGGNRIQSSPINQFEEAMAELVDLEALYNQLMPSVLLRETRVYRAIERLDMEEQNIIIEKYIHNLTWYQVAANSNYSERQVRRIRDKALSKLVINGDFMDGGK